MEKNLEIKNFIKECFENSKKLKTEDGRTYFETMIEQRMEGPTNAGSSYDVETIEELYDLLMSCEWEETTHPGVMEGCRAFKANLPGLEGIIDIDNLPDDTVFYVIDPKETGTVGIGAGGVPKKETGVTYLIIGKEPINGETLDMVYTFHPGEPIKPSQIKTEEYPDGETITRKKAKKLGLNLVKFLSEEMRKSYELKSKVIEKLKETKTVVTHFVDDLDNKASVYALERFAKKYGILKEGEHLNVERVPAGQVKEGMLNVDTGGHKGNRIENETIVIDGDPVNGVKSAAESLSKLRFYVPKQIVELADVKSNKVSALDSGTPLSLMRYIPGETLFKLAEDNKLEVPLTDEELKKYGLEEAHKKQQEIIDKAVEKTKQYCVELKNGKKIVLAPEQILAGSNVAYEMGVDYYVSAANHIDKESGEVDGVTFVIARNPEDGNAKLPENVLEFGKELVEKYRIDEKSSGVFVFQNGQMIVAGGGKNPDFRIENVTVEEMLKEIEEIFNGERTVEKDNIKEMVSEDTTLDDISKTRNEVIEELNAEKSKDDKAQGDD